MIKLYIYRDGEEHGTVLGIDAEDCMDIAGEQNLTEEFGYQWVWQKPSIITPETRAALSAGPLSPEQLADILDEPHTRRAWWLDLHTSGDLLTGTTITDLNSVVERIAPACARPAPGNGETAVPHFSV